MDRFLQLLEVGTSEVNKFLQTVGVNFVFSSQLLSATFIIVMLCVALLVTLIGDKRSRSIILMFVFLGMLTAVCLFMLHSWMVMTGRR